MKTPIPISFLTVSRNLRGLCLGCVVLATAVVAQAQITFTINATPTDNVLGYVMGQNYNFSFTLTTDPNIANPNNFSSGSANNSGTWNATYNVDNGNIPLPFYSWRQEWTTDPQLWTSVSGQGLAGTWVQPGDPNSQDPAPDSYLSVSTGNYAGYFGNSLTLIASADEGNPPIPVQMDVGLTAAGTPVRLVQFFVAGPGLFSPIDPAATTLPDPNAYFAGNTSFNAANFLTTSGRIETVSLNTITGLNVYNDVYFTVNGLTIAGGSSAVPEPSTYGVFAGLGVLGFAAWRRRKAVTAKFAA